jgi:hypothetical protein
MRMLLNSRDIAALNRARKVLKRLEDAAWRTSLTQHDPLAPVSGWDLGQLSAAANAADDAIFNVLNSARTHCGVKITDSQLVGETPAQSEEPTGEAPPNDVTNGVPGSMSRTPASAAE